MNIIKKISNYGCRTGGNDPKWIIIHETDNEDRGADALCHARALANGNLKCSAHYYVDDRNIVQVHNHWDTAYHVGTKYGTPLINGIYNRNSIGIEICVNKDGDYNQAVKNAIELVKYLIVTTKIQANRVARHYDACRKYCPRKMLDNPNIWAEFKTNIQRGSNSIPPASNSGSVDGKYGTVTASVLNVRSGCGQEYPIIGTLNNGQTVKLFKDKGNGWYEIYYGDHGGFVSKLYINL